MNELINCLSAVSFRILALLAGCVLFIRATIQLPLIRAGTPAEEVRERSREVGKYIRANHRAGTYGVDIPRYPAAVNRVGRYY